MATTDIEWADRVWNPVTGCTKVSQGCKNCYAETIADRFFALQYPPVPVRMKGDPLVVTESRPRRFTDVMTHSDRLADPLGWRKPSRVFVNSMSDLFHEDVQADFIERVFDVMAQARRHTFLVLTKRPQRMLEVLHGLAHRHRAADGSGWPLPNVHLGVSVEDQATADERIPLLLQAPAAVRWVSYEPALGPVDFRPWLSGHDTPPLDWIVVGGESGHGARQFDLAWARSTVAACRASDVPVFVKQVGSNPLDSSMPIRSFADALVAVGGTLKNRKGGDPSEWPEDLRVRELPEVA